MPVGTPVAVCIMQLDEQVWVVRERPGLEYKLEVIGLDEIIQERGEIREKKGEGASLEALLHEPLDP